MEQVWYKRSLQRNLNDCFILQISVFIDFSGVTEYETVVKYIDSDDLVLIISVSGEADSTIDFAKKSKDQRNTDHFDHKTKEESIGQRISNLLNLITIITNKKSI